MTGAPIGGIARPSQREWERCVRELEAHAQALEHHWAANAARPADAAGTRTIDFGVGLDGAPARRPPAAQEPASIAPWARRRHGPEPAPLAPYPGHGAASVLLRPHVAVGFYIARADAPILEDIVRSVFLAQRDRQDFSPVFITECSDVRPFLARGYVFEYLPPAETVAADDAAAEAWRAGRLDWIRRKWGLSHVVREPGHRLDRPRALLATDRPRIVVFPDYGPGNPYIDLAYRAVRQTADVAFGPVDAAIAAADFGPAVFHLHWEDAVYRGERDDRVPARMAEFVAAIDRLKARGGRFLWTVHNLMPHECRDEALHAEFMRQLALRADIVHVNNAWTADGVAEALGADLPIRVVEHPSYEGCYPAPADRDLARRQLGIDGRPDETLFLFVGNVRRYKGVARLLEAAARIAEPCRFVIAGRSGRYDPCEAMPANCMRVDGFVDDDKLARLFAAADFAVLPFETLSTSGSLLLALSFGVPVIAPRVRPVTDLVEDGRDALLYPRGGRDGLYGALCRALDLPPWQRRAMAKAAEATAAFRAPEAFSAAMRALFEDLLQPPTPAADAAAPARPRRARSDAT
ncbi:MAG: glycosyltransferase family 4 protein [Alphaproteobacteria bacterium]